MSAYIYRIDEGLQFFALQSGIAERCIKAIQDFAYSGFGGRGGNRRTKQVQRLSLLKLCLARRRKTESQT